MLNARREKYLTLAFIIAELALGIAVQLTSAEANRIVSFSAVALAAVFVWIYAKRTTEFYLSAAALIFTVIADFFLVLITPTQQIPAMLAFLVVQSCYFVKILRFHGGRVKKTVHISVRAAVSAVAVLITLLVLGEGCDALAVISIVYFANLILNVIFSFIEIKKNALLATGLLLFLLCDIFVGLSMIDGYLPVMEGSFIYLLAHPSFNAAWLFYVPAQTLLSLSAGKSNA